MNTSESRYSLVLAMRARTNEESERLYAERSRLDFAADQLRLSVCKRNDCRGAEYFEDEYIGKCSDCLREHGTGLEIECYDRMVSQAEAIQRKRLVLINRLGRIYRAEETFLLPPFGKQVRNRVPLALHRAFAPVMALFGLEVRHAA